MAHTRHHRTRRRGVAMAVRGPSGWHRRPDGDPRGRGGGDRHRARGPPARAGQRADHSGLEHARARSGTAARHRLGRAGVRPTTGGQITQPGHRAATGRRGRDRHPRLAVRREARVCTRWHYSVPSHGPPRRGCSGSAPSDRIATSRRGTRTMAASRRAHGRGATLRHVRRSSTRPVHRRSPAPPSAPLHRPLPPAAVRCGRRPAFHCGSCPRLFPRPVQPDRLP